MQKVEWVSPTTCAPAQGLYSHASLVKGGGLVFIAGQLAVADDGGVYGVGDFDAQFAQVFDNLGRVLAGLGGDWNSVVKFTTYLTNADDISRFMVLRKETFPEFFGAEPYPPNTLLIVDRLVKPEFLVEVEAVAAI